MRSRRLVVAVTGTPGTGKSTFAEALAGKLGAFLLRLNDLVEETGIYEIEEDGTKAVRVGDLRREFRRAIGRVTGHVVVEGHMSHLLPGNILTHVVVLRSHPDAIFRRLVERGYDRDKAEKNAEAEALDIILWEAVKEHGTKKVFEIDTTERSAGECVNLFLRAMKGTADLKPGRMRWLEEYLSSKEKVPRGL